LDEDLNQVLFWQNIGNLARNGSMGIAALVVFLLGWMFLRKMRAGSVTASPEPGAGEPQLVLKKLESAAQADPRTVALVLEKWLNQSDGVRRNAA
jgi:flagellar biosynthesis/type III secretory pathway M-ring protein FliF/YscJ